MRLTSLQSPFSSHADGEGDNDDLLLADGQIDARERKFLQRLAVNFNIRAGIASRVIEAVLVKNHLQRDAPGGLSAMATASRPGATAR